MDINEMTYYLDLLACGKENANRHKLNLIKYALRELQSLREENEWISVEDRLPDEGVPVLVTQHEYANKSKPRYYDVCVFLNGVWLDEFSGIDVYEPTHWMPLPEPQEEI